MTYRANKKCEMFQNCCCRSSTLFRRKTGSNRFEMATMPRDTNQRYKTGSHTNGEQCRRKTRSRSAANFVDSLLPAASTMASPPLIKKIRLNTSNMTTRMDESSSPRDNSPADSGPSENVSSFLASSALSAFVFGENATSEKFQSDPSNQSNEHESSSPIAHSGRSSAIGSFDDEAAPFLTNQEECPAPGAPGTGSTEANGGNYFACVHCNKYFWTETSLKHHSSLYHSEKSFVCEICGKAFRFRSNLAEHRSVHTSLKPYVCKFCGKSSRLKGNLTKHILKHHKKEQNAYIGKDDIIIKKGKKSIKDPAAVDFLEKSMIVLTTATSPVSISTTGKQPPTTGLSTRQLTAGAADFGSPSFLSMTSRSESKSSSARSNKRNALNQSAPLSTPCSNGDTKPKRDKLGQQFDMSVFGEGKQQLLSSHRKSAQTKDTNRFPISDMLAGTANCFLSPDSAGKLDLGEILSTDNKNQSRDVDAVFESLLGRSQAQLNTNYSSPFYDFSSGQSKSTTLPLASSNLNQVKSDGGISNGGAGTRCTMCGKHFRKAANLAVHVSIKHNQAAPSASADELSTPGQLPPRNAVGPDVSSLLNNKFSSSNFETGESNMQPKSSTNTALSMPPYSASAKATLSSKLGQRMAANSALANALLQCSVSNSRPVTSADSISQPSVLSPPNWDALNGLMTKCGVSKDLKEIRNVLQELKRGLPDVAKLDELLSALDARVDRLERQLETSVNTLYILVQMQTDMNSAFCQFKNDVVQSLKSLKSQHADDEEEDDCEGMDEEEEDEGRGQGVLMNGAVASMEPGI